MNAVEMKEGRVERFRGLVVEMVERYKRVNQWQ